MGNGKITTQQRWNRYVDAINFCIKSGYCILIEKESQSGNIQQIRVRRALRNTNKEVVIKLKPKKYRPMELFLIIHNRLPIL